MKVLRKTGHNQTMIATILSTDKSMISRELSRNLGLRGYRPKQAQVKAMQRRHGKPKTHIPLTTWVPNQARLEFKTNFRSFLWKTRNLDQPQNGLIRQYLSKSQALNNVTQKELNYIMDQLNHRSRKTLGFKTLYELFFKKNTLLTVALHTWIHRLWRIF